MKETIQDLICIVIIVISVVGGVYGIGLTIWAVGTEVLRWLKLIPKPPHRVSMWKCHWRQ